MFVSVLLPHQVILSQSQDKSLRRIGELREVKQNPKYFHFQKFSTVEIIYSRDMHKQRG